MLPTRYACSNPEGRCADRPQLDALNKALGCLVLDGDCRLRKCPSLLGGASCPAPCGPDDDDETCMAHLAAASRDHDCAAFYLGMTRRALARTPLPGCTAACAAGVASPNGDLCCSDAVYGPLTSAYDGPGGALAFHIEDGGDGRQANERWSLSPEDPMGTAEPLLVYQNFLNDLTWCMVRTQACPSSVNDAGRRSICSGNGQCHFDPYASTDSAFSCACSEGFLGAACDVPGVRSVCPMSWSDRKRKLEVCGGGSQGTCVKATHTCRCLPGWTGAACATRTCATVNGRLCAGNGTCTPSGECVCLPGYSGAACECSAATGVCEESATSATQADGGSGANLDDVSAGESLYARRQELTVLSVGVGSTLIALLLGLVFYLRVYAPDRARGDAALARLAGSDAPAGLGADGDGGGAGAGGTGGAGAPWYRTHAIKLGTIAVLGALAGLFALSAALNDDVTNPEFVLRPFTVLAYDPNAGTDAQTGGMGVEAALLLSGKAEDQAVLCVARLETAATLPALAGRDRMDDDAQRETLAWAAPTEEAARNSVAVVSVASEAARAAEEEPAALEAVDVADARELPVFLRVYAETEAEVRRVMYNVGYGVDGLWSLPREASVRMTCSEGGCRRTA